MHRGFSIIALAILIQLTGSACFKFSIARDLNNSEVLEKSKWAEVEVTAEDGSVSVTVDIPVALPDSEAFIFFANDKKEILQVNFNETVRGRFYEVPYKLKKETKGGEFAKTENEQFRRVSGTFPRMWLPEKCNKVNAALVTADGQYYNYYKIQNFQISLPDLLVVEEYKNCSLD